MIGEQCAGLGHLGTELLGHILKPVAMAYRRRLQVIELARLVALLTMPG